MTTEIYLEDLFLQVDRDCFREIDVYNNMVMYIDGKFYTYVGEEYVKEYPDQNYKMYDEKYIKSAKDLIKEEENYKFNLMIQNCINWMFSGENTNNLINEKEVFEDTFKYFYDVNFKNVKVSDVYKYLGKYV